MKIKTHHILNSGESSSRRYIVITLLMCLLCSASFMLTAQENYEVRKIVFRGNKVLSRASLLENMSLHPSNIIQRLIQRKEPSIYSTEFMNADLERLTRYYQSEGFLHAAVWLDSLQTNEKKHTVNIYISIQENEPVKVDSISFKVTDIVDSLPNINESRALRRIARGLELKEGSRFVDQTLYGDVSRINGMFMNRGYVYVETDFDLKLDVPENLVDIDYNIRPGILGQFGETTISGNHYVKEKYIRKPLRYKPGETFSSGLLDKTRKDLYDLQLFRIVSIVPQTNKKTQLNPIPIHIEIQEMPRWMSKFGVGWGTEDKFRAFADVTYRGLFGGTSRLNLYAKHSALTPYYISLNWIEPQFFVNRLAISVNPYIKREKEPGYDIQRFGLNAPLSYTFNDYLSSAISYYFERVKQFDAEDNPYNPNIEGKGLLYNKSGLTGSLLFDNSAPVFSPDRGWQVSVGAKLNGYFFGSNFNYTRLWVDARKYQSIGSFVVSARAMIGGINSSDPSGFIPVEDRFYAGGSNSNRGWARAMLGPKRPDDPSLPLGGKSILEMNLEVRHKLVWLIDIAAFTDIGNVWVKPYYYRLDELAYSVGGGLRLNTPIGPVRFDVGVPLGKMEKRKVQFFLSIGQAF